METGLASSRQGGLSLLSARRVGWITAGAGAIALGAVFIWLFVFRDTSKPVTVGEAVAAAQGEGNSAVYVYRTSGSEEIDVLLGSRHDYPSETTITLTGQSDGCSTLRWDALQERSTTWKLCTSAGATEIRGYRELHRFIGQTKHTDYVCDPGSLWRTASEEPGTPFERRCVAGETTETARGRVVGIETVTIDGEPMDALHLRLDLTLEGRTRGTGTIDLWLRPSDGLVLRLALANDNRSASAIGDVHYTEQAELELISLEPRS